MSALDHPPAGAMWEAPHPLEKVNAELRAELAAAREELAALRKDALRYRWLREAAGNGHGIDNAMTRVTADGRFYRRSKDMDDAIDAALQESRDHD